MPDIELKVNCKKCGNPKRPFVGEYIDEWVICDEKGLYQVRVIIQNNPDLCKECLNDTLEQAVKGVRFK